MGRLLEPLIRGKASSPFLPTLFVWADDGGKVKQEKQKGAKGPAQSSPPWCCLSLTKVCYCVSPDPDSKRLCIRVTEKARRAVLPFEPPALWDNTKKIQKVSQANGHLRPSRRPTPTHSRPVAAVNSAIRRAWRTTRSGRTYPLE